MLNIFLNVPMPCGSMTITCVGLRRLSFAELLAHGGDAQICPSRMHREALAVIEDAYHVPTQSIKYSIDPYQSGFQIAQWNNESMQLLHSLIISVDQHVHNLQLT